jgi:hypothetical protein
VSSSTPLGSPVGAADDLMIRTAAGGHATKGAGGSNGAALTNCRRRGPTGRLSSRDPQSSEAHAHVAAGLDTLTSRAELSNEQCCFMAFVSCRLLLFDRCCGLARKKEARLDRIETSGLNAEAHAQHQTSFLKNAGSLLPLTSHVASHRY